MPSTTLRRRAVAVATTAALAAIVPMGTAHADTKKYVDPAADMFQVQANNTDPVAAPTQVNGDVTAWSVTHSSGSVTVRASFTDLSRTGTVLGFTGTISTNTGMVRQFTVAAAPGKWKGKLGILKKNGKKVSCTSSHKIDYSSNKVVIKMARSCFDKPKWVKAQFAGVSSTGASAVFADDALSAGAEFKAKTVKVRHG